MVGLSGGIGSGKSTVAAALAERGASVVDADAIAREVVEPGGLAYAEVVQLFGPEVVGEDGRLDRAAIARRVFADPAELAELNRVTHPAIGRLMAERIATLAERGETVVVLDIPLLNEASRSAFDLKAVVVVDVPEEVAVSRLVHQRGFSEEDARARIAAQISRAERRALADVVIDNSGDRAALEAEVDRAWTRIEELASQQA